MKGRILVLLLLAIPIWWFFLQAQSVNLPGSIPSENGSVQVLFCPQDQCEAALMDLLKNATSIQCALYSLKLPNVTAVLKEKNADLLIDEDNYAGFGKKIVMSGLMHDKFCVLNDQTIWSGSLNPTPNGAYKENNNLVIINSRIVAENYKAKFDNIKNGVKKKVKHPKILLNGFLIENYFCPEDDCEKHVLDTLKAAKQSVYFLTYSFTSDEIGEFLVQNKDRLEIRGVMEKSQASKYSEFMKFKASNMSVHLDKNSANMHHNVSSSRLYCPKLGNLHHKVFIIDNETVITGSYNPTAGGDSKNRENVLILHNADIARQFLDEFECIWNRAAD
ncbi:MAG TPA: phospholipase D-like domain-containing protein [Candidatus Nanoarchaeia archaeon]|nr:phospholipase D-like domain-containing protein [Candidatus Nanoarchaeia archaeon]